jgi:ATP-dependent Lhr-like helicase
MVSNVNNQQYKIQLKRTWHTFYGRYNRLYEIQSLAIPVILSKKNAILVSSTASGKTEAVIAPLCERILSEKRSGLSILYVTPTRALTNDLYDRLNEQLSSLNITFEIKTGDKPTLNWKKVPEILVTTPESLDSIICRHPESLFKIMAVVIDEIHLMDGTYRGDQLRFLLQRLRKRSPDFAVYALSATISDPIGVASRYMEDGVVIQTSGSRTIKETYVKSLEEVRACCKTENLKKLIIFCNSRKNAEVQGLEAKQFWPPLEVVVHHGSLHKKEREESERVMKTLNKAVCSATMTLEIGIDIGDVEAVVLAETPLDVSSLIQRIGRSGRRTGVIRVFALTSDDATTAGFKELFEAARKNLLEKYEYFEDYSVIVQQIYSMLYAQRSGITEEDLCHFFEHFYPYTSLKNMLIPHLTSEDKITRKLNKIYATEVILNLGDRGQVHSNIPNTRVMEVYDTSRKQAIGDIQFRTDKIEVGERFVLAGKMWEITEAEKFRINVKPIAKAGNPANFPPTQRVGAFFYDLPESMQEEMIQKRSGV